MKKLIMLLTPLFSLTSLATVCENENYIVTFNITEDTKKNGYSDVISHFPKVNSDDQITIYIKAEKKLLQYKSIITTTDGFGNDGYQAFGNWADENSQFFKPTLELSWDHEGGDLSGYFYGYELSKYGYKYKTKEYFLEKIFKNCESVF